MSTKTNPSEITQQIAIVVTYLCATNYHGSRVKLTLPHWSNKSRIISYDHAFRDTAGNAIAWMERKGITPSVYLDIGKAYAFCIPWEQRPAVFAAFGLSEV